MSVLFMATLNLFNTSVSTLKLRAGFAPQAFRKIKFKYSHSTFHSMYVSYFTLVLTPPRLPLLLLSPLLLFIVNIYLDFTVDLNQFLCFFIPLLPYGSSFLY